MKSDFVVALHILGFLTAHEGRPLSSGVLAEIYGTNAVVIRRVLSKLQKAGLVESRKVPGVFGNCLLSQLHGRMENAS